jgi:hypothetical protein
MPACALDMAPAEITGTDLTIYPTRRVRCCSREVDFDEMLCKILRRSESPAVAERVRDRTGCHADICATGHANHHPNADLYPNIHPDGH